MKSSAYNYYLPYDGGVIFMNGITESSFWVEETKSDIYRAIIENPNEYELQATKFIDRMKSRGFILEDTADEDKLVAQKYEALQNKGEYLIMILPTYSCNLRCWYCVQSHKNEWLQPEQYESLKALIKNNLSNSEIDSLRISWFGGEPILAYDSILKFTTEMRDFAVAEGKSFRCGITSNATLLDEDKIEALRAAGVDFYQITIDGDQEAHDKVKQLNGASAFERTMRNIASIAKHTHCVLLFNYGRKTLYSPRLIDDVTRYLPSEVRKNISINFQPVWQESFDENDFQQVVTLMEAAKQHGLSSTHKTGGLCYVDQAHFDCVYPSGEVGKCENDAEGMAKGHLMPGGKVNWDNADTFHYIHNSVLTDSECKSCRHLPLCWGPCSRNRFTQLKDSGKITCFRSDDSNSINELIRNIFISQKYIQV